MNFLSSRQFVKKHFLMYMGCIILIGLTGILLNSVFDFIGGTSEISVIFMVVISLIIVPVCGYLTVAAMFRKHRVEQAAVSSIVKGFRLYLVLWPVLYIIMSSIRLFVQFLHERESIELILHFTNTVPNSSEVYAQILWSFVLDLGIAIASYIVSVLVTRYKFLKAVEKQEKAPEVFVTEE